MNEIENQSLQFHKAYIAGHADFLAEHLGPVLKRVSDPADLAIVLELQSSTDPTKEPFELTVFERANARTVLDDNKLEPYIQALQIPAPPGLNHLLLVTQEFVTLGQIGVNLV